MISSHLCLDNIFYITDSYRSEKKRNRGGGGKKEGQEISNPSSFHPTTSENFKYTLKQITSRTNTE
jgi:hypothetical protein